MYVKPINAIITSSLRDVWWIFICNFMETPLFRIDLNGRSPQQIIKSIETPLTVLKTHIFPLIFIGILGGSLQSNLGASAGYDFLAFVFTGVLA